MEDKQAADAYTCPSFSSYSSDRSAEIAVRVTAGSSNDAIRGEDDEDFQFSFVREEVSAAEFFNDGRIRHGFPVFNRDLLENNDGDGEEEKSGESEQSESVPLSKLFIRDREADNTASCSSSEVDELESIPEGTYCVWRPRAAADRLPSPSRCKKSNSTGSASKRWKFRDLLLRSNSEGKDSFVFLTPKNREDNKLAVEVLRKEKGKGTGGGGGGGAARTPSAHEALYVRNRAIKEGNKKKSFLPYRRDLVGFFVNVNGLGQSFPRF